MARVVAPVVSIGLDVIPVVGNAKSAVEALTGRDLITGAKLTKLERSAALLGTFTGGAGKTALNATLKVGNNIVGGSTSSVKNAGNGIEKTRPSWRQSENDVGKEYPGYRDQVSYKDGKEVSHGTKNSSRPDFYTNGHSIEVKNYNLTTSSGRSNLIRNVSNQVNKRLSDLPENTKQTVIIDVRGQNVSRDVLRDIKQKINERTNGVPEIIYKMD